MTSSNQSITLIAKFAWWFKPYVSILIFFCSVHRTKPDPDHLYKVTRRAIRIKTSTTPKARR